MKSESEPCVEVKIGSYTNAERAEKIKHFLEKRKRRNWRKKVKYGCRKKLADSRPRVKGRFVPRALQEKFKKEGCHGEGVTPPKKVLPDAPKPAPAKPNIRVKAESKREEKSWNSVAQVLPLGRKSGSECAAKSSVLIPFTNYCVEMGPYVYTNEDLPPITTRRPRTNSLSFLNAINSYTRHTEGINTSHMSNSQVSYA